MIDALLAEIPFLEERSPATVLEVGPGSGVVITSLAMKLSIPTFYFACDVNKEACLTTQKTM